jgi:hypothetical protein
MNKFAATFAFAAAEITAAITAPTTSLPRP